MMQSQLHKLLRDPRNSGKSSDTVTTRTFKIFRIDVHPKKSMLIVRGEVTVAVSSVIDNVVVAEEAREFRKLLVLNNLNVGMNTEKIVEEILLMCPIIDAIFRRILSSSVDILKKRCAKEATSPSTDRSCVSSAESCKSGIGFSEYFEDSSHASSLDIDAELTEVVDMTKLDDYVELMYENLHGKVQGSRCLHKLTKQPENLVSIASHETALNAIFRTLREDYKKSLDLTTNIMGICLSYSRFIDFHPILFRHKVCSMACDVIQFELRRYEKWRFELKAKERSLQSYKKDGDYQLEKPKVLNKLEGEVKKMASKFQELTRKQDCLLCYTLDSVYYLMEKIDILRELKSQNFVVYLSCCLDRKNLNLVEICLKFLKRLSFYHNFRREMEHLSIVSRLSVLISLPSIPSQIKIVGLELLANLSMSHAICSSIVKFGMVSKLSAIFEESDANVRELVTRTVYNMSIERKFRKFIFRTPLISQLFEPIRNSSCEDTKKIYIATCVNLARSKKGAVGLTSNENSIVSLLQQAFESEDELILKILRNLSFHDELKGLFKDFTCDLSRAVLEASNENFIAECVGILSNLNLPEIDYYRLIKEYKLMPWIINVLDKTQKLSTSWDDRLDEKQQYLASNVISWVGTCATDLDCANLFMEDRLLKCLIELLSLKYLDAELKVKSLYSLYKFCFHDQLATYFIERTDLPSLALKFFAIEEDTTVITMCEAIMELIAVLDDKWQDKFNSQRFCLYNQVWLEAVSEGGYGFGEQGIECETNPFAVTPHGFHPGEGFVFSRPEEDSEDEYDDDLMNESKQLFEQFKAQFERQTNTAVPSSIK